MFVCLELDRDWKNQIVTLRSCYASELEAFCIRHRSSFEWNMEPFNVPDLLVSAGTACYGYQGVCDELSQVPRVSLLSAIVFLRGMEPNIMTDYCTI